MAMSVIEKLMTAEEYLTFPNEGRPCELVLGRVVFSPFPGPLHGMVCASVLRWVDECVRENELGHLLCNNAGHVARRGPDTVRGPDISYFGYDQLPKGKLPWSFASVAPRLIFEVFSFDDSWLIMLAKASDHLQAGGKATCVLDPEYETVHVFRADQPFVALSGDDELRLPDILGDDFSVPVKNFFV